MPTPSKIPTAFRIKLVDVRGNSYLSDIMSVSKFVIDNFANTAMTPEQAWNFVRNHIRTKMAFTVQVQDLAINIAGVETFFNPSHIISISLVVS